MSRRKSLPKWVRTEDTPSTRSRSDRQETAIAQILKGKRTLNSGATFGENDVVTDYAEIECKTTEKASFSLKLADWDKLVGKAVTHKIPMMAVEFAKNAKTLAILDLEDLRMLIDAANGERK